MDDDFNPFDGFEEDESSPIIDFNNVYNLIKENNANGENTYFDSQELEDAIDYFMDMDFEKAEEVNDFALSIFPDNSEFLLNRVEIYFEKELDDDGRLLLDKLEKLAPTNTRVYELKAKFFLKNKHFEQAIGVYLKALSNNVEDPVQIFESLSFCYMDSRNFKAAISALKKCIELEADYVPPYYSLTDLFITTNTISDGIFYFDSLINDDALNVLAMLSIANLFNIEGMYKNAVDYYERVLAFQRENFEAIFELIAIYKKIKNFDAAIEICDRYKDLQYPFFEIEKAKVFITMGSVTEALDNLLYVFNSHKEDHEVILNIAECYLILELFKNAENYIDLGLSLFPESVDFKLLKAEVYQKMGADDIEIMTLTHEVMEYLDLEYFTERAEKFASLYMAMGKYELAIEFLTCFDILDTENALLNYWLASAYYQNFQYPQAYQYFEKALGLSYDDYFVFFDNCMLAHADDTIYDLLEKYKKN